MPPLLTGKNAQNGEVMELERQSTSLHSPRFPDPTVYTECLWDT
jgi:hypothetical protein